MKNILVAYLLFIIYSCNSIKSENITIYPSIRKQDSVLILSIKNNTDSNLMIEYPELDNFYYKDEFDSSNSEVLYIKKSFDKLVDKTDKINYENLKCKTVQKLVRTNNISIPKFIKSKSEKKYYFKITRYRKGKTIVFKDDGFDLILNSFNDKKKSELNNIRNQKCIDYKYFTGRFKFYPDAIILP
ncbi:hypothetical protein MUU74_10170 [Chryseobacterium daecheongense]|uniref:hypothetical protein n=1 Tax=Chryseobacterium daecheongense TaxID=192389 RepID=UPI001FD6866E|nr:hypothetical protein [Chryseobacterium daecheongense]UOU96860.1 hypothetical protein MUU74_10170 [Chryseobacterium daecheongense]